MSLADLLPGQALERRRELPRVPRPDRQRPQDQHEEDHDREDGEAQDAAAVAFFEREGGEQAVDDFGPGDDQQGEAGEAEQEDVGVSQRAPAPDRVDQQQQAGDDASAAQRRQFGWEDASEREGGGDHARREDRAETALERARAARGKTSVISTSLRRGAASEIAPTAVTSTIGVASA